MMRRYLGAMRKRYVVASEQLRIRFDGSSIVDGTMDARELGRTLVNLSDVLVTTNGLIGEKDQPAPRLKITGTDEGSFIVDLAVIAESGVIQATIDGLAGKYATAGANLTALLTVLGAAMTLLKKRGNRTVVRVQEDDLDPDFVRVEHQDGTVEKVPAHVWIVASNPAVQKALRDTVRPVTQEGVDKMEIYGLNPSEPDPLVVTAEDYPGFIPFDLPPEESVERNEVLVSIESLAFEGSRKWRLNDGEASFPAEIKDQSFMERVEQGDIRFAKGDTYRVLLEREQALDGGKLKTTYRVVQVLRHYPSHNIAQGELFPEPEA
jgi:hypothetical protein